MASAVRPDGPYDPREQVDDRTRPRPASSRPLRILVVDDDADMCGLIAARLRAEMAAEVTTRADGYQALAALDTDSYDAVLLNLMLPGINGIDVLDRMHVSGTAVPTVVICGMSTALLANRLSYFPFVGDVHTTPIDFDRLMWSMARLAARSHL